MKRRISGLTFLVLLLVSCKSQDTKLMNLKSDILKKFQSVKGDFALAFKNPDDPSQTLLINEHESFHAASTMKTPVMIEVFKQAEEGKFNLQDSILIKNEFKSIVDSSMFSLDLDRDSGEKLYQYIGQKRLLRELVVDMIIHSSNLATNLIIEWVDAKNVTKTMRQLGAPDIQVLRGVEDMKAYEQGLSNATTAFDLMKIYEALALEKAVNPQADQAMIDILLQQQHNDIIPAHLPEEIKVAHKTGWITGVRHDSGIVYLPDGRKYVLVVLSKNVENMDKAVKMMAEVSRMVYEYVK